MLSLVEVLGLHAGSSFRLALVAVLALGLEDFDLSMVRLGANASREVRATMRRDGATRSVEVLGVRVAIGGVAIVRDANATLELRYGNASTFVDLRRASDAAVGPLLCKLRRKKASGSSGDLALLTSVSDFAYLWKYWRWMLNKLCAGTVLQAPYYLWVGAPLRGRRRAPSYACPARVEEPLAHTTKALSMYLTLTVAKRVLFVDSDAWFRTPWFQGDRLATYATEWLDDARDAHLALPAPCYKQFFGAAVVFARRSAWTLGVLRRWYDMRCGPKDQPSLWSIVLRASGRPEVADRVAAAYRDARCVNRSTGELTKSDCACPPRTCGYYRAWELANSAFRYVVWPNQTTPRADLYEVKRPLFTPGGKVAYLPNVAVPDALPPFLCGQAAPVTHVKWLRKRDRDLPPALCGHIPPDAYFKGPRDNVFTRRRRR